MHTSNVYSAYNKTTNFTNIVPVVSIYVFDAI